MLYIIAFIFFQIIQSSNLLFNVGLPVGALAKNGSFGFLSVGNLSLVFCSFIVGRVGFLG